MTLGERIKYYRKNKGITQQQVADAIGTSNQNISRYEHGVITDIPLSKLYIIADLLEVDLVKLIGRDRRGIWQENKQSQ